MDLKNPKPLSLSYEKGIRPVAFRSMVLGLRVVCLLDRKSSHRPEKTNQSCRLHIFKRNRLVLHQ